MKGKAKVKAWLLMVVIILSAFVAQYEVNADFFEIPLACEGEYTLEQTWTTDFDLGVTFTEISNIYIDWSGSIRAEFVENLVTGDRFPMDAQFIADLYDLVTNNFYCRASLQTGAATYPNPEPFDLQSTFSNGGWSMLLDGQGTIEIGFWGVFRPGTYITIEEPNGELASATLVIEGITFIELSNPNGGESLPEGSTYTINWADFRSDGNCPGSYLLELSSDNGGEWFPLDSNSVYSTCSYDWVVPSIDSNQCLIRISDANDTSINDVSDAAFTIYECTLAYDLNHDCFVNMLDFALLVTEWLTCGKPFDPNCVE